MNAPTKIRSVLLFLGLPALWVSSFSLTGQVNFDAQQNAGFEFIPVSVHASHSANYHIDPSTDKIAPVDEDIVTDAQSDQGITPPDLPIAPQPTTEQNNPQEPKRRDDQSQGAQPTPAQPTPVPSQSNSGQGGSTTGTDNGNKDKGQDSPGQSGADHGNNGNGNGGNGGNSGNGNGKNK